MNDGEMEGMQTFDKVLEKMIRNRTVTKEIGLAYATNANNLALAISDMDQESGAKPEEPVMQVKTSNQMPEIEGFEL
jgi:twitching motility protein PilT